MMPTKRKLPILPPPGREISKFWQVIRLTRISIREMMMLTVIAALLIAFFYTRTPTFARVDLTYSTIQSMVTAIEPNARIQYGSGGIEKADLTYLVPKAGADRFFDKLLTEVDKKIKESGWSTPGCGKSTSNGLLIGFNYHLKKGTSRCVVQGILLRRNAAEEVLYGKDVEEIRFIILSPHVR